MVRSEQVERPHCSRCCQSEQSPICQDSVIGFVRLCIAKFWCPHSDGALKPVSYRVKLILVVGRYFEDICRIIKFNARNISFLIIEEGGFNTLTGPVATTGHGFLVLGPIVPEKDRRSLCRSWRLPI